MLKPPASVAFPPAAGGVVDRLEPAGAFRGVSLAEFGQRDAGAAGVLQLLHRDREVEQAVGRARAGLVGLKVLQEPRRCLARLAVVEQRAAEQVAAIADARMA